MRWILICCLFLAGCNQPMVKTATPRNVIVKTVPDKVDKALVLAEIECQKHGRHAVYVPDGKYTGLASFDCVD